MFNITILGIGSATQILQRNPTSQVLSTISENYLIDCGEGTQKQLLLYKIKVQKIKKIFISHLHGDHIFGLIGLICSMNLAKRTEPLIIFAPKGLNEIIAIQLKYSGTILQFKLTFCEINTKSNYVIFEDSNIKISTIPLFHRVPCSGFIFENKEVKLKFKPEYLNELNIFDIKTLKTGVDVLENDGKIKYSVNDYTYLDKTSKKYAFCSDTSFNESIIDIVNEVNLLYHEATFLNDLADRAKETGHSTASQAALTAKKANVNQLLLGHFSSRYKTTEQLLYEAIEVFENSIIAEEGKTYEI